MATWIIGDVHGCWRTLKRVLKTIDFNKDRDELIQVGDLVNKGPGSLEVLRWARSLGPGFRMVLGNHDLHLLARIEGGRKARKDDTVGAVLEAPDREELVGWLRKQPLLVRIGKLLVVHAGLMPDWSVAEAEVLAAEGAAAIRSGRIKDLYRKVVWSPELEGMDRVAAAVSVMTRIRMVGKDGLPIFPFWGPREKGPKGAKPWFEDAASVHEDRTTVFGHWATLGFFRGPGVVCLDSGCVYGGTLTAFNPDDGLVVQADMRRKDGIDRTVEVVREVKIRRKNGIRRKVEIRRKRRIRKVP